MSNQSNVFNNTLVDQFLPNFVSQKASKVVYVEMQFHESSPTKRLNREEQWIRDLHIFKRESTSHKKGVQVILDQNEVTNQMLIQKLSEVSSLHSEIEKLRLSLEAVYQKYKWALAAEDR